MGGSDSDDLLTKIIGGGDEWDPVEEQSALAKIQAEMFSTSFEPFALDRYVMLEAIGSGGGGIVYSAYDPDLHRKVAVKVLRTGEGSTAVASSARLLREAQAIAQLNHPNVVSVFDVGRLDEEVLRVGPGPAVYMVMELIEGVDLREWLDKEKRGWREVLETFVAAGRGLEAAHAQGLIHRDFKPANVVVGHDGRARVLDFGLARAASGTEHEARPPAGETKASPRAGFERDLTDVGTVMGTPRYMAPEQHRGETADARTDQYCFCVALHEALAGGRLFDVDSAEKLLDAKLKGAAPLGSAAPKWVSEAVSRGLDPDPDRRFASMSLLLAELDRDPGRRLRRGAQLGGLVVATAAVVYMVAGGDAAVVTTCTDSSEKLRGVWDEASRAQAEQAFLATGLNYAGETWTVVEGNLEAYAQAWVGARTEACQATLVDGKQSPEAMALQMLCLDQQFEGFAELARLVADADAPVVRNAVSATSRLASPTECRNASSWMGERIDLEGGAREQILALDAQLLRASVLGDAGRYSETRALAEDALERATALDAHRTRARALQQLCDLDWLTNHFVDAQLRCEAALVAAEQGRSDLLAFEVLLHLGRLRANLGTFREAERIFAIAQARLESIPLEQRPRTARAELAEGMGLLRDKEWREEEAHEFLIEALALYEDTHGPRHPEVVSVLNGLGMVAASQGKATDALDYYQRALAIVEESYGPSHPNASSLLNNMGGVEYERGRFDDALDLLTRSLKLKEQHLGDTSPRLVTTLGRIGDALTDMGRGEEALIHHARAVKLQERAQGEGSQLIATPIVKHARTLRVLGRCDEAVALLDRATELSKGHENSASSDAATIAFERAQCAKATGDPEVALAGFERALVIGSEQGAKEIHVQAMTLVEIADILLARGNLGGAKTRLLEARGRCEGAQVDPRLVARIDFARGRVLAATDRGQAMELVRVARESIEDLHHAPKLLDAMDVWMKRHGDG